MSELAKKASEFIVALKHDWDRLSGFVKFCFLLGIFTVLTLGEISASDARIFGVLLLIWAIIFLAVVIVISPILYWSCDWLYIRRLRLSYPIKRIGKDFEFILVGNAVCIVYAGKPGFRSKHIRWIDNPRTLYDLGFSPYWNSFETKKSLKGLVEEGYKIRHGLRTRGRPGPLKEDQ
jgi:hypothetical protein